MTIKHIPGKENTTADALSRYPVDPPDTNDDEITRLVTSSTQTDDLFINMVTTRSMKNQLAVPAPPPTHLSSPSSTPPTPLTTPSSTPAVTISSSPADVHDILFDYDTLKLHQDKDPGIQKIKNVLPLNHHYSIDHRHLLYKIVTRKNGSVLQIPWVPASLVPKVLYTYHNSTCNGAHFGIKRTFYKIRDRFFWPNMYKDIEQHVLSCINCQKNKPSRRKPDGHLHSIEPPRGIWQRLAMDYVGPVPSSKSGNKYFLVLTDLFSKFVVTKAVPDNTSTTAAKFLLYDVFMIYGVPYEIITDNGQHFSSSLYESLLKLTRCCHIKTTPYNPQANGQCERHNATLVPNLVALSNNSRSNWDEKLLATTFNYNTTQHTSTGYSPFELMFARLPRFPADLSSPPPFHSHNISHFHDTMKQFIDHIKTAARHNNIQHQLAAKQRFDQNRSNPSYSIGQSVLVRNRQSLQNKFSPRFVGPYTIINRLHRKTYIVQNSHTGHQAQVSVQDIRLINPHLP
jgi:transposase InsO family protein